MQHQVIQSVLTQLSQTPLSAARVALLLAAVEDNQLLPFLMTDAEQDMSETRSKSAELRTKWNRRVLELIGSKNDETTRLAGLNLLLQTVQVTTYEFALAHYESWFAQLLGIIAQKAAPLDKVIGSAMFVTSDLLRICQQWPDIKREVMKENCFGTFVTNSVRLLEERHIVDGHVAEEKKRSVVPEAIQALAHALLYIPHNKLRTQQARLIRTLVAALDSDPEAAPLILEAMSLIPDNSASWNQIVGPFIEAMHYILHHLYEGFEQDTAFKAFGSIDESNPSVVADTLRFFVSDVRHKRANLEQSLRRLQWMAAAIDKLLRCGPSSVVAVPVDSLLDLIEHFLLLDGSVIKSKEVVKGLEPSEVVSAIPLLHQTGLKLLESCVMSLRSSMLSYAEGAGILLVDEFNRVRNRSSAGLHGVSYRMALYSATRRCLQQFRASAADIIEAAASAVLRDMKIKIAQVDASIDVETTTVTSSKKRGRNNQATAAPVESNRRVGQEDNISFLKSSNALLISALATLETIFQSVGSLLNPEARSRLDKALLALFIDMQRGSATTFLRPIVYTKPFDDARLRIAMYKTLIASSTTTSRTQAPILTFTLQFLSVGVNDPDFDVSELCSAGISTCAPIINPRVPLIPTPISDDQRYNPLVPFDQAKQQESRDEDAQDIIPAKRPAFASLPTASSSFAPPSMAQSAPAVAPAAAPVAIQPTKPVAQVPAHTPAPQAPAPVAQAKSVAAQPKAASPAPANTASRFAASAHSQVQQFDVDNVDIVMDEPDSDEE